MLGDEAEADRFADALADAYDRFGKGRRRERLNTGDCCAFAMAKNPSTPILRRDNGFYWTNIRSTPCKT
jgi:uncharacterized protein with PIN domain